MKKVIAILCALLCVTVIQAADISLHKQGSATQLYVDGKPFVILGGELGNSSASSPADIARIFPKLQRMNLNTVLVPVYWDMVEPVEGDFDFFTYRHYS